MPARKASIQDGSGDCGVKKPILAARCCARVASGHMAVAAPNAINSRRRITASTIRASHCNRKPDIWKVPRCHVVGKSGVGQTPTSSLGPHVRSRRVQTLVQEGSPLVKLRNSGGAPLLELLRSQVDSRLGHGLPELERGPASSIEIAQSEGLP